MSELNLFSTDNFKGKIIYFKNDGGWEYLLNGETTVMLHSEPDGIIYLNEYAEITNYVSDRVERLRESISRMNYQEVTKEFYKTKLNQAIKILTNGTSKN